MESDITPGLTLIGEKIRTKVDPILVIKDLIHDQAFSKDFRDVSKKIMQDLKTSTNPIEALSQNRHPSYMMRMTMFILYAVLSSGRVNAAALSKFTEMMSFAVDAKTKFRSGMMAGLCWHDCIAHIHRDHVCVDQQSAARGIHVI